MNNPLPKILVVVGPTASGKSALGISLAQKYNGEIISADSRQVYRGLNLGTGKVTKEEMMGIPHHLIDIADPMTVYTAADFVRDARKVASDIISRGKLPIVVGGTFFYIDAFLGKIELPPINRDTSLREELALLTNDELLKRLSALDPDRAKEIDRHNPRRLIRAIEIAETLGAVPKQKQVQTYDAQMLGIQLSATELRCRIRTRLHARLDAGMVKEVEDLHAQGLSYERMDDLGLEYRYIARYLEKTLGYEEMVRTLETKIWQYAKRQLTWLKRDTSIEWVHPDGALIEKTD